MISWIEELFEDVDGATLDLSRTTNLRVFAPKAVPVAPAVALFPLPARLLLRRRT